MYGTFAPPPQPLPPAPQEESTDKGKKKKKKEKETSAGGDNGHIAASRRRLRSRNSGESERSPSPVPDFPDDSQKLSASFLTLGCSHAHDKYRCTSKKFRASMVTSCSPTRWPMMKLSQLSECQVDMMVWNATEISPWTRPLDFGCETKGDVRMAGAGQFRMLMARVPTRLDFLAANLENLEIVALRLGYQFAWLPEDVKPLARERGWARDIPSLPATPSAAPPTFPVVARVDGPAQVVSVPRGFRHKGAKKQPRAIADGSSVTIEELPEDTTTRRAITDKPAKGERKRKIAAKNEKARRKKAKQSSSDSEPPAKKAKGKKKKKIVAPPSSSSSASSSSSSSDSEPPAKLAKLSPAGEGDNEVAEEDHTPAQAPVVPVVQGKPEAPPADPKLVIQWNLPKLTKLPEIKSRDGEPTAKNAENDEQTDEQSDEGC